MSVKEIQKNITRAKHIVIQSAIMDWLNLRNENDFNH